MYVGEIPIPYATDAQKAPIIKLVQTILADPDSTAVPKLEAEIDKLVYILYNLTTEEIKIIENLNESEEKN
jgi:hypothetical protein